MFVTDSGTGDQTGAEVGHGDELRVMPEPWRASRADGYPLPGRSRTHERPLTANSETRRGEFLEPDAVVRSYKVVLRLHGDAWARIGEDGRERERGQKHALRGFWRVVVRPERERGERLPLPRSVYDFFADFTFAK